MIYICTHKSTYQLHHKE